MPRSDDPDGDQHRQPLGKGRGGHGMDQPLTSALGYETAERADLAGAIVAARRPTWGAG